MSASVVAGVASTLGNGGTHYVSSLSLANPHPFPITVTAYLLPAGSDNSGYRSSARVIDLPAGGGTRIEDPLASLSGRRRVLPRSISSRRRPPETTRRSRSESRVTNVANPAATFGLALPGTLSGVTGDDVGLGPDVQSDAAYRTNFGIFNDSERLPRRSRSSSSTTPARSSAQRLTTWRPTRSSSTPSRRSFRSAFRRATLRVTPPAADTRAGPGLHRGRRQRHGRRRRGDAPRLTGFPIRAPFASPFSSRSPATNSARADRRARRSGSQAGSSYRITFHATDTAHGISAIPQLGVAAVGDRARLGLRRGRLADRVAAGPLQLRVHPRLRLGPRRDVRGDRGRVGRARAGRRL